MKKQLFLLILVTVLCIGFISCAGNRNGYTDTYQHKECLGRGRIGHSAAY